MRAQGEIALSRGCTQSAKLETLLRRVVAAFLLCVIAGQLQVCMALPSLRAFEGQMLIFKFGLHGCLSLQPFF